ncbi:ABC transporter ATP-binding protein [Haloparvum sp. PAK95]|uniref:ABC transporter ATP-binding protein n=1 Tax=Haloparvum sp. PAK95 TaxID=3418962 RepID=UPI003D2EE841
MTDDALVQVRDLEKHYYEDDTVLDKLLRKEPTAVRAVDGVSFDVHEGETLGIVGESGCGKSTTAETLMRLREPTAGSVVFDGEEVFELSGDALQRFRRRAQVMFQDPFSSLDPRMTAGEIIREPLEIHEVDTPEARRERAKSLLEEVGLSADQVDRYPHEFSGGQRQRIGFARALALEPEFIVLDEPVSALDVSVQAQVLNLLADMQEQRDLTYLFIAHDLSVVRHICDRVAVMYLGEIVEVGPVAEIFEDPQHPYTQALLESVPRADTAERERDVKTLRGDVPSPRDPPSGCSFRTRCPKVIPPADLDLPQAVYREIADVRTQIERDELDLGFLWQQAGDPEREDAAAFARAMHEEFLPADLPDRDEELLTTAFETLAAGDREEAADLLRDRYESVCETVNPQLPDGNHPAACHLKRQPAEVEAAVEEWERE